MKEFAVLAFEFAEAALVFVAGIRLTPDCAFVNHYVPIAGTAAFWIYAPAIMLLLQTLKAVIYAMM